MIKRRFQLSNNNNAYDKMSEISSSAETTTTTTTSSGALKDEWEMRPGGMLVQKRNEKDVDRSAVLNVRLKIAYGALRYEISVNSQATFGEVKKLLTADTGLQPGEQKLVYKGKERENGEYLDTCGVKDRSKVILIQDPTSIERRYIEMKKNARIQTVHRAISDISMEVDRLVDQVSGIEKCIRSGVKVAEIQITTLIELLMRQAIKLDSITAEGDEASSAQKILQGKRVQKSVESLDMLKISNAKVKPVIVTTKWETFDHPHPQTTANAQWELFDSSLLLKPKSPPTMHQSLLQHASPTHFLSSQDQPNCGLMF